MNENWADKHQTNLPKPYIYNCFIPSTFEAWKFYTKKCINCLQTKQGKFIWCWGQSINLVFMLAYFVIGMAYLVFWIVCLVFIMVYLGVERNRNQVFVPERDILFPYFKFRFRQSRYRISGRKKAGKFVIL